LKRSFNELIERIVGVDTDKVYSVGENGLEHFEHVQGRIDQLWKLVKDRNPESSILPYTQSTMWWIPGHGDSKPDCGHIKAKTCENVELHPGNKVFGRYYKKSCLARDCPICCESWSSRRAEYAVLRIATYLKGADWVSDIIQECKHSTWGLPRKEFHKLLNHGVETALSHLRKKVIHWVVSPPTDSDFRKPVFQKLRQKAYRIARIAGFKGGEAVFHPYRLHCRVCDVAIPEYSEDCPSCGGHLFKWIPSPHFHFIGFGWAERTDEIYAREGWIVKNLGVRKSIFWTVQYVLSHAGVFKDQEPSFKPKIFNVTTWIGELSYNKKIHPPKLIEEKEKCPYCGYILYEMADREFKEHPPPENWAENQDFLF
jgi:ssDNA-binding Zn-finger/Zn-ribbon topoisomerase 1